MILPYIYFGALFVCTAGLIYFVVTDIIDRARERKYSKCILDGEIKE